MIPGRFHERILMPGLEALYSVCGVRVSQAAARWLLAVALQESGLRYRYQRISSAAFPGPARGWWQFEQGGGVAGVLRHPTSAEKASALCDWYAVEAEQHTVWRTLEGHDGLAVGFARLLLLTDPAPIPTIEHDGWTTYLRVWRPGKPHPQTWPGYWKTAEEVVR